MPAPDRRAFLPKPANLVWAIIGVLFVGGVFGFIASGPGSAASRTIVICASTLILFGVVALQFVDGFRPLTKIFYPLAVPLAYLIYALLVPLLYMSVTGKGIGSISPSVVTWRATAVMLLFVGAYVSGVLAYGIVRSRFKPVGGVLARSPQYTSTVESVTIVIGRIILGVALAAQIYELVRRGPIGISTYGSDQLSYSSDTTIAVIGEALVAVGCLLVMHGNAARERRPLKVPDWVLVLAIAAAGLALGSRNELIAPILLYFWYRFASADGPRKLRPVVVLVVAAAVVALTISAFVVVADLRSGSRSHYSLVQTVLWQTSSPALLTGNVTRLIPSHVGYYGGSTYLAALKSMLPGPITRDLFGSRTVDGTGAIAYRSLIHFTDPNQGWGFAIPTEAYENFGFAGVIFVGMLVGAIFQAAASWTARRDDGGITLPQYIYPLLMSYLPYGLRSDALSQLKSTLYPIVIIWVSLLIARALAKRRERSGRVVEDSPVEAQAEGAERP